MGVGSWRGVTHCDNEFDQVHPEVNLLAQLAQAQAMP
jgi:hypothetical protein